MESVHLGFHQLILVDKEITEILVLSWESDDHFGFKLNNDALYGHFYIDQMKDHSSVYY